MIKIRATAKISNKSVNLVLSYDFVKLLVESNNLGDPADRVVPVDKVWMALLNKCKLGQSKNCADLDVVLNVCNSDVFSTEEPFTFEEFLKWCE